QLVDWGGSGPPVSTFTCWYFFNIRNIRVGLPVAINSTNMDLLGVPVTKPPTKEQAWTEPAPLPHTYGAYVQLCLHVSPQQL
ncbi:mCG144772, partial [Mus musculus]